MKIDLDDQPWMEKAECKGIAKSMGTYELFFSEDASVQNQAKKICARCEVRLDCLAYALDYKIPDGIWGGMTEGGRRKYKRKLSRQVKSQNLPQV